MCPLSHICAGFALRLFFSVEIVKGKHNLIAVSAICNLSAVISSPAGQCWELPPSPPATNLLILHGWLCGGGGGGTMV